MNHKTRSFFVNSLSAYLPFVIDFFLKLLLVRIILLQLGAELLGTWGILKSATVFPLFLQQGLSFAVFVQTSRSPQAQNHSGDALAVSSIFGALLSAAMMIFAPPLTSFFRISPQNYTMAITAFRIAGANLFFTSVSTVFVQILQGRSRFDLASAIVCSASVLESILSIVALHAGYQILTLLVIELCITVLTIPVSLLICRRVIGTPLFGSASSAGIRSLLHETGGQLSVTALTKVIWELDAVLIPRFFGLFAMASYWIVQRLVFGWRTFLWAGAWPALPAIAAVPESAVRIQRIHLLQASLAIPMAFFLWNFAPEIIRIWTGSEDVRATFVMRILVLAGLIDFLPATLVSFLFGRGLVFKVGWILMSAAIVKILLSSAACLAGSFQLLLLSTAAAAFVFSILIHIVGSRESKQSLAELMKATLPAVLASGICLIIFRQFQEPNTLYDLIRQAFLFFIIDYGLVILFVRLFFPDSYVLVRSKLEKLYVNK